MGHGFYKYGIPVARHQKDLLHICRHHNGVPATHHCLCHPFLSFRTGGHHLHRNLPFCTYIYYKASELVRPDLQRFGKVDYIDIEFRAAEG